VSYDQIPGFSGFLWLYDKAVAEAKDGDVFVEVGVALGHSLAYLARKVIDSGKRIEVWAVDPFAGYARNGEQQESLGDSTSGDFGLFTRTMLGRCPQEFETVRMLRATSVQAARLWQPYSLSLVMIDGAHDQESLRTDIDTWRYKMKIGGLLAGDDHEPNYPGVEAACRDAFDTAYTVTGTTWHKRM
jgi:hypothetical protein